MKRQRNAVAVAVAVAVSGDPIKDSAAGNKRRKIRASATVEKAAKEDVAVTKEEEAEVVVAEAPAVAVVVEESSGVLGWEENWWPWLSGVVDEQMSWGAVWLPFWDVDEFMGDEASPSSHSLFSDVFWDDDIWGLRGF
ncbi:uncharacterized protein LOC133821952 [Humulus lupulus]|uniref:uncharacterized protein LOC133821952 n=1 Tax=Humulus lupulus TaxID=3486 RepID=UPI002B40FBA2|nr:uncharacterized protein LOC133821952 [Humulus lupulus]